MMKINLNNDIWKINIPVKLCKKSAMYRNIARNIIEIYQKEKFKLENYEALVKVSSNFSGSKNIKYTKQAKKESIKFINLVENALNFLNKENRELIKSVFIDNKKFREFHYSQVHFYQLLENASKKFCELILC